MKELSGASFMVQAERLVIDVDGIVARVRDRVTAHARALREQALFARTGGLALPQRHDSRKAYRLQEMARQSRKHGLPINPQPMFWPVNTLPAGLLNATWYSTPGVRPAKP